MRKAAKALFNEFRSGQGLKGQLLRGGFWSLGIKLSSTLMSILLAIVLARLLGAEGYGIYSFIFALVSILAIPAQLGLPNLVVRETAKAQVAEHWNVMRGLWRWATSVALIMSLILIIAGVLATRIFAAQLTLTQTQTLWWGLALVPLVALGNLRGAALRGLRKIVQGQLPEFVLRPAFFILLAIIASLLFGHALSPVNAMMLHVIASILAFTIGAVLLWRARPPEMADNAPVIYAQSWLSGLLPLALIGGMQVINANIGVVVLGFVSTHYDVANFRIAMQASLLVTLGLYAANQVASPYYARFFLQRDTTSLQSVVSHVALASICFSAPTLLILLVFGRQLIAFFFGAEFSGALTPTLILSFGQLINSLAASVALLLSMTGHADTTARVTVVTVLLNAALTILLSYSWDAVGAAAASAATMAVYTLTLRRLVVRKLGVEPSILFFFPTMRLKNG